MSEITTKEILLASAPIVKSFVDTLLTPKLERLKDKLSIEYKKNIVGIEKYFTEYFERTYTKYSIINTLVFNNSELLLKDLFIPLTIKQVSDQNKLIKIDGFPFKIAKDNKKILITDTAGMGKSTLVKRILLDVIDKAIGIPIIIELRRLNKDKTILNELHEQLSSINKIFDEKLLLELLTDGDFIFFLDGFDEIALADRDKVTRDIQQFTSKANCNRFFMTSRPESALSSFGDFQQFSIEPLKKIQAYQLLKNYDSNGKISTLLIKKLKQSEFRNIDEFLTNPLLVSLLFTAFEYKQVIPFKKHIFYRQVYDANFEAHDLTKGDSYMHDKYSQLDIDDFHRVMRHLGFSCLKIQKIEFSKDELLSLITQSQLFCTGLKFKESDFLKDLISTVPLFTKDGIYYRWSHKSLQEYFAAQFIYLDSKEFQIKILEKISQGSDVDKYYNILDIYYDIDFKSFRDIIIHPLLIKYKKHFDKILSNKTSNTDADIIKFSELTFPTICHILMKCNLTSYEQFHTITSDYETQYGIAIPDSIVRIVTQDVEKSVYSGQLYSNSILNILSILRSKKHDISVHRNADGLKDFKVNFFGFLEDDIPLLIDYGINSKIIAKNLSQINKILSSVLLFQVLISHRKAIALLDKIESENSNKSDIDNLLAGL
jgi:hypothetical protein